MRRTDDQTYILGSGLSSTGPSVSIKGGAYTFEVSGTIGGATISLQFQTPNGTWTDLNYFGVTVKSTSLPFVQNSIDLPAGNVRMAATGGAPSGLTGHLIGVG